MKTSHPNTANRPQTRLTFLKITGVLFILFAAALTLFIPCPSKAQYFTLYVFVGIGIAMLLARSAEQSKVDLKGEFKIWNISIALTGGVALPFILFFTNPIGNFKEDNCDPFIDVTVFVHGKKGRQEMPLRQQGHVVMDVRDQRLRADINENGAAYFQELRVGERVRLNVDFSEPYRSIFPDSVYEITRDTKFYLPIELAGMDKVEGMVLYNNEPLEGVTVKIGSLLDSTDENGGFAISIPESLQNYKQTVWFIKKGYKSISTPAFPQDTSQLVLVMEKN